MTESALRFEAMGCPCEFRLAGPAGEAARTSFESAAREAVEEIARIEKKYSRYRADSLVSEINRHAGGRRVPIDEETAGLLRFAGELFEMSGGLFDITSGVLRRAWDFRGKVVPSPELLERTLACVGWQDVELGESDVRLPREGMELDFGGFGKEYAADRCAALLKEQGIEHGYVNLGGDIRILGPRMDGRPWSFGIAHPRKEGQVVATIHLSAGALATSGDYERFFELDGRRYCHILDPRTGYPVDYWQSVSVAAPICSAAGAVCTVAMLLQQRGTEFIAQQGLGFLAVDSAGQSHSRDLFPADQS